MTLLVLSMLVLAVVLIVGAGLWSGWFALRSLGRARTRSSVRRIGRGVYVGLVGGLAMIAVFRGFTVLFPGPATAMTLGKAVVIVAGIVQIAFVVRPGDGARFDPLDRLPSLGLGGLSILVPELLASGWLLVGVMALHWVVRFVAGWRSRAATHLAIVAALLAAYGGLATGRVIDELRQASVLVLASVAYPPGCSTNG